ncbi:zinc finger BED domain-containing protein 1-like [Drosophila innubila]|uniref:zinc finger BED domain-containing protein 1-like n=1 Tax=Drosophila innubila TaxID=198719 RepID=UPI00148B5108|nr:zinc finger BED domain-containing protein 1-like [Drosophila innubila]
MDKFLGVSENNKELDYEDCSAKENEPKRKCAKSNVWNYFKRLEGGSAKCLTYGNVYKTCGNTTNLSNHLKRAHPTVFTVPKAIRTLGEFFDTTRQKKYERGSSRKISLDKALIGMIATDLQPFRIVEDAGFRNFVHCLDPQYAMPSRRTLIDVLLSNMYEEMNEKLKHILTKVKYCAVTTDGWTSRANDHYLTVSLYV